MHLHIMRVILKKPVWKMRHRSLRNWLIQLLNIAGLGPIFGALAGACWGPSVFLWITFGTLLGGGVHDYMVGMMSMRHKLSLIHI